MVLSTDNENDPDLLALIGASAAVTLSPAPFEGPIGAARVGYVNGEYVVNPTHSQLNESEIDLLVAGPNEAINMIECSGKEVSEDIAARAIELGQETCRAIIEMINELVEGVGVEKSYEPAPLPEELKKIAAEKCGEKIRELKQIAGKADRFEALMNLRKELLDELCPAGAEEPQYTPMQVKEAFYKLEGAIQREMILSGQRPDGRKMDEIRPLDIEVSVLPRTHGSAIFARGETQALATVTLGTPRDQQIVDGLLDEYKKTFMLHYNFPPFSVGEIRPIRGPGRREIGHGALAEKSLQQVMPSVDDFPYTVRVVSDIMESNGSTSQASVCAATMALMDAGVPIKAPVAGISIGMVSDGEKYELLTDILGEEDFHGDMDFKVAGTRDGITAIQLDMKARGIPQDRVVETLERAREARLCLLEQMCGVLDKPRKELNRFAPRMLMVQINPDKIGKIIGPGGKTINRIQDATGASIDIEEDGRIFIASGEGGGAEAAKREIELLTEEVQVGKIYEGSVVSIRDFGAFIEILPGQDGLCHVSELDEKYVKNVADVINVGDKVRAKVINIDEQGRVKLSRKAAMKEEADE